MTPSEAMAVPTACILVVDDEPDNRELLEIILASEGFRVVAAASGAEALAIVGRDPPDLIVLDVMMPGMSGYEVTAKIRANPATSRIPILIFSAVSDANARMLGLSAGADDYLAKPVEYADLVKRVRDLLKKK
jgi:DNA-binding response OmpR family regulator